MSQMQQYIVVKSHCYSVLLLGSLSSYDCHRLVKWLYSYCLGFCIMRLSVNNTSALYKL